MEIVHGLCNYARPYRVVYFSWEAKDINKDLYIYILNVGQFAMQWRYHDNLLVHYFLTFVFLEFFISFSMSSFIFIKAFVDHEIFCNFP